MKQAVADTKLAASIEALRAALAGLRAAAAEPG
jgi:hypothetical protein